MGLRINKTKQFDQDGFLTDRHSWTPELAVEIASRDGITLTDQHWEIIRLVRRYYEEFDSPPAMRALVKYLKHHLGDASGNSIYLFVSNKLSNITNNNKWSERADLLSKSFHSYLNSNFTQMFSYIKILDIYDDNVTVTINSKYPETVEKIKELTFKKYMDKATIIYKEDNNEEYFIICKKQTCSPKLKNLEEVKNYFNNL